ncbi:hypothetical protein C8R43DRAFT_621815 [Mycena crocata]|nr:hypothetical protein C8R43DRAFT_621815 [Mycena crocata]
MESPAHAEDLSWAKSSPSKLRIRLSQLDGEMEALESKIRLLAIERRAIMKHLECIVYPILSIPPEIIVQISAHYVDKPQIPLRKGATSGRHGPLLLASICKSWRNICISNGALWSCLDIRPSDNSLHSLLSLLQCWLSRAGSHPLDLRLLDSTATLNTITHIQTFLSQYSSQWRTLSICGPPSTDLSDRIIGRIPSLEKLSVLNTTDLDDAPEEEVTMTAFSDAPLLREVVLSNVSISTISLPWAQLTHLDFTYESVRCCVEILRETPNLQSLIVSLGNHWDIEPPAVPLTLSYLHTLTFYDDRDGALLEQLTLPALTTLTLANLGSAYPLFEDIALRSTWPLRTLRLANMDLQTISFCLHGTPSVENVDIVHPKAKDLAPLIDHFTAPFFVPALRVLTIEMDTSITNEALVEMLTSRWAGASEGVSKFKSFRLFCPEAADGASLDDIWRRVNPLVDEGLQVVLGTPSRSWSASNS